MGIYSPKQVDVTLDGVANITGWESISMSRNSANSEARVQPNGEVHYTKIADKTGTVVITLPQTDDDTNLALAALQRIQDEKDDLYFFNILVNDKSGGVVANAKRCHLMEFAEMTEEATISDRAYTFFCENLEYTPTPVGMAETVGSVVNAVNLYDRLGSLF